MVPCSLGHLAITCIVLFAGALGAGLLPLSLRVSDAQLRTMTALGAGLLIGAALAVVVPEGFDAFDDAQQDAGGRHTGQCLLQGPGHKHPWHHQPI